MSLLTLILTLVVVGVVMWLVNAYIPMSAGIQKLLNIAVIVILVLWLLHALGLLGSLNTVRVGP